MEGIVTITIEVGQLDKEMKAAMNREIADLGLEKTLPETEGGTLYLPEGTYGAFIELGDQMERLKHYYRSLVGIMRKVGFKGKYFVGVAANPAVVCGEL